MKVTEPHSTQVSDPQTSDFHRNSLTIVRLGLFFSVVATLFNGYLAYKYGNWQFMTMVIVTALLALFSLASILLIQEGRTLGMWVFILAGQLAFTVAAALIAGVGLISMVSILVLTLLVAIQSLPAQQIRWAVYLGLTFSILSGFTNWYVPSFQVTMTSELNAFLPVLVILMVLAYGLLFLRGFRFFSLRTQLVSIFIVVSSVSVAAIIFFSNFYIRRTLTFDANIRLYNAASQTSRNLDEFINLKLAGIQAGSQLPDITDYMSILPDQRSGSWQQVRVIRTLSALAQQEPDRISSVALLDPKGINIADSLITDMGQDESNSEYFTRVVENRQPYVSSVQYSPLLKRSLIYFSTPVIGESGDIQGILRVRYDALALDHILESSKGLVGSGSYAVLVDENGIYLSLPKNPGLVFKSIAPLDETMLAQLKAANRLPDLPSGELSINLPGLKSALDGSMTKPFFTTEMEAPSTDNSGSKSIEQGAIVDLHSVPWKVIYTVNQASLLAPIEAQTRNNTLLGLLIGGLAALGGLVMAQVLTAPISRLTEVARQVAAGDLTVQAPLEISGELGMLAKAFNAMTSQLMQTLEGLEQRIAERTQQVEHRAVQLRAAAEISRAVANIRILDELLPKITQLISEQFGFYHVGIFLMDPAGEFAVLRATNSEGGKRMLETGHKLKVGEVGIVGYATGHKESRIAMDVGQDAIYFNNPDLPETRAECALPLIVGNMVLGALDVQSKEPGAFSQEDITTLQLLADQVAIAIDNARLFSENQAAIEATRRAYGELSREAWAKMMHEKPEIGALANPYDVIYSPAESWTSEMLQAAESGSTIQSQDGTVAIPIRDRDHNLGVLRLRKPVGLSWSKEELNLAETLAEQLFLALENARLYRETQHRAERERQAGDITAKMRQSNDPQVILQTAVQELRRALNLRMEQSPKGATFAVKDDESDNGHNTPDPS